MGGGDEGEPGFGTSTNRMNWRMGFGIGPQVDYCWTTCLLGKDGDDDDGD